MIPLMLSLTIRCLGQGIIWDETAEDLFPDIMYFSIIPWGGKVDKIKKAEFDYRNNLIAVTDTGKTFDVKSSSGLGSIYIILEEKPSLIKTELISFPLDNKEELQRHHRAIIYNNLNLNSIKLNLRKGVIYTKDDDTKDLAKKYKEKTVEGKLLSISPREIYLLEKTGSIISLSEFQIEDLKVNDIIFSNIRNVYDLFFKNYQEYSKITNNKFLTDLKNSSLEQIIEKLGAFSNINTINGRTFIDWKYTLESYSLELNNKSITRSTNSTIGYSEIKGINNEIGLSSSYYTPSITSSYVSSYYNSNRQSAYDNFGYQSGRSSEITSSNTNGEVIKTLKELSIVIELSPNNQVIKVIQNGILPDPVYGLSFLFIGNSK
jgi:hypothetical protein